MLANAACYAGIGSSAGAGGFSLTPQLQVLSCQPAKDWRNAIPDEYLTAFENAAARYELGKGVWALAAVAQARVELRPRDGQEADAEVRARSASTAPSGRPTRSTATKTATSGALTSADSAATLARLIWSRGSIRAGIFTHNQAHWYVQAVLAQAAQVEGGCKQESVDWPVALPEASRPRSTGTTSPSPTTSSCTT